MVVNGYEYYAVVAQEVACKLKARIHHIQPISVVSAACFGIGCNAPPGFVYLAGEFKVVLDIVGVVVRIHKFFACVIGRIYVYHFNFAEIGLLQKF